MKLLADRHLIEVAFPLKQVSLDSVHEKNVRHGHISTLHIWPVRRPLAASRATLLATLLPDPDTREERRKVLRRMDGTTVETPGAKGKRMRKEIRGGIGALAKCFFIISMSSLNTARCAILPPSALL